MGHKCAWVAAFLLASVAGSSILGATEKGGRAHVRFDQGWRFHLLDKTTGEPANDIASGIPVKEWRWKLTQNPVAEAGDVTRPDFDDASWDVTAANPKLLAKGGTFAWLRTVPPGGSPHAQLHFERVDDVGTIQVGCEPGVFPQRQTVENSGYL